MAALALSSLACAPSSGAEARPSILLVVIDTLRADRLPFYGCPRPTAPALTALARDAVVFERASATSSWTVPSTSSLFTSTYPFQHGVDIGFVEPPDCDADTDLLTINRLPAELETLPEYLRRQGYRTFGVADNKFIGPEIGFDRGFDHFEQALSGGASEVTERVRRSLPEIRSADPWFLYLHFIDPHTPYHAREPWFDPSGLDAADPESESHFGRLRHFLSDLRLPPDVVAGFAEKFLALRPDQEPAPDGLAELVDWALAAYDSEISHVDHELRLLLDELGLDDVLLVVTSDHGEQFLEHAGFAHDWGLWNELVRVPLLVRWPERFPAARVTDPVGTIDLLPTLRDLLGTPPLERDRGRSLLPLLEGTGGLGERSFLLERRDDGSAGPQLARAIVSGRWKWIDDPLLPEDLLFDVRADPEEREDLADSHPETVERLRAEYERRKRTALRWERTFAEPVALEDVERGLLHRMGYLDAD